MVRSIPVTKKHSMNVISVKGIGKKYEIGAYQQDSMLREHITAWLTHPLQQVKSSFNQQTEEFWALKDISFEVKEGEVLGIIGKNGAGKSTLLKILSRITTPTEGEAIIRGRVASLLEVGTGFNTELTGRENIFLNGSILGMSRVEIKKKFDSIVDFSGVEKFIDTPVKRYSSGMHVRLAFAVAAHLEPEILVVDEVLAVGDAEFQKKCLGKMDEVAKSGRTVLFVSHNMAAINSLTSRSLYLKNGKIYYSGPTQKAIDKYISESQTPRTNQNFVDLKRSLGKGRTQITDFFLTDLQGNHVGCAMTGRPLVINLKYTSKLQKELHNVKVGIIVKSNYGYKLTNLNSRFSQSKFEKLPPAGIIRCKLNKFPITIGSYSLDIHLVVNEEVEDSFELPIKFEVENDIFYPNGDTGFKVKHEGILIEQEWDYLEK